MSRRLFIVWSHPLFRAIVNLLLNDPTVDIVGAASEWEEVLAGLESLRPDVVIVEETEDTEVPSIEALAVVRICPWGPQVIRLSLQDNELWVYSHERRVIGDSADLLHLVRDS